MIASPLTSYQWLDNNVMVAVRIGPQTQTPKQLNDWCEVRTRVLTDETQVCLASHTTQVFTFEHVFDANTEQQHIYDTCVKDLIDSCFDGFNATVLAYGQTGSGKTYTMGTGFNEFTSTHNETTGIIPRAVKQLFSEINKLKKCARDNGEAIPEFKVNVQYIELYNEEIKDLLIDAPSKQTHEDSSGRIYLNDVTTRPVNSIAETLECLKTGAQSRTTDATLAHSSRSHAIFTLHIKQHRVAQIETDLLENGNDMQSNDLIGNREFETLTAKFHFVDLAGSECAKKSGTTAERAHESKSINQTLLALDNVISTLGDKNKKDIGIPSYRDSKLTHLLQDSLGGNSVTLMIACISPCHRDYKETLNTLQCANRAKDIINKVTDNHNKPSQIIIALRSENQMLRNNLEEHKQEKKRLIDCEKMNEALKRENIKQNEELNEYKTLHQNLSKTFDEKCSQYNRVFGLYEELQKDFEIKTQENEEKFKNLLNNLNACEIEKQSIIEHKNQILCENEIQKQKIEECVKVNNEKENLVISCNTKVKNLQKQLNESEVAFNQLLVEKNLQKEKFDKLESVLNNLQQKTLEIIKLNENLSKTFDEKCAQYEELQKDFAIKTQENVKNLLNKLNACESEKQSIIEHNKQILRENEIQKQKIEECVKIINEKETLVNSCNAEKKQLNEREVAFNQILVEKNHQKEEFDKLESVLNNLQQKSLEIIKLNENISKTRSEKCSQLQSNSTETHSLSQSISDTMSGDNDIEYEVDMCDTSAHNNIDQSITDTLIGDNEMQSNSHQLLISHIRQPLSNNTFDANDNHIEIIDKTFNTGSDNDNSLSDERCNNAKQKPYKCVWPLCDKKFSRKKAFTEHKYRHIGYKPYKCENDDCVNSFVRSYELNSHIRHIHTKQKLFKCDFDDCGKEFVTSTNLKTHRNRHIKYKPYKCNYDDCVKSFVRSCELKVHKKNSHTKIKCDFNNCGKEFVTAINLRKHKLEKHA